ncbi:hypothetical protein AB1Y20_000289 [Prymnesium parvum]|uniref:Myotubularin phosphatase domain-containing protein n=1 Tax=Prymnesium parvum TaxID=97485 RepID=A0AB34K4Z8_PRYPA
MLQPVALEQHEQITPRSNVSSEQSTPRDQRNSAPCLFSMRRRGSARAPSATHPPIFKRKVMTTYTLPTLSPLHEGEGLVHIPIFATLRWGETRVPGTIFVTNHRLLWEVSDAALSLGAEAIEGPEFIAVPIHSIDSLRLTKKGQAGPAAGGSVATLGEVVVKYAAQPQLKLLLGDGCEAPLLAALNMATLTPPTKPSDLRADVTRSLAFAHGGGGGVAMESTPGESAKLSISAAPSEKERKSESGRQESVPEETAPEPLPDVVGGLLDADPAELEEEYRRMGVGAPHSSWRLCRRNLKFALSPTYPHLLAVPAAVSDDDIARAAEFRSNRRFPVLCWKDPSSSAVICRSSQPKVGVSMSRNSHDEQLLQAIVDANPSAERLQIVDCRPRVNAELNHAKGKGYEHTTLQYRMARLTFAGIENIHVIRSALKSFLKELRHTAAPSRTRSLTPQEVAAEDSTGGGGLSDVDKISWIDLLRAVLRGGARVAHMVSVEKSSVLVHCSDGWDRTPQVTALAQLMLDCTFRTRDGFRLLIEKEWLAFGHQFAVRCGTIAPLEKESTTPSDDQIAPIFLQFIDCVWQLTEQLPTAFEFNSRYLITLLYHVTSCQYGTFLCDCARQRSALDVARRTQSVWHALSGPETINHRYQPTDELIVPDLKPGALRPWLAYYCRTDPYSGTFSPQRPVERTKPRPATSSRRGSGYIKVYLRRKSMNGYV